MFLHYIIFWMFRHYRYVGPSQHTKNKHEQIYGNSSNVIDLGANRKRICNFLLVIISNFVCVSLTVFEILTHFAQNSLFSHLALAWRHPSRWKPWDINLIYTPLESRCNALQFRHWQYGIIFVRLAVVGSQIYEISRNSEIIRAYS